MAIVTRPLPATTRDAQGNLSSPTSASETVTVTPLAPTLAPLAETALAASATPPLHDALPIYLAGDANSLAALVVSAIPVGATLSDGTHSFTATAGNTAVDVHA